MTDSPDGFDDLSVTNEEVDSHFATPNKATNKRRRSTSSSGSVVSYTYVLLYSVSSLTSYVSI